jgi:hypothetical protein
MSEVTHIFEKELKSISNLFQFHSSPATVSRGRVRSEPRQMSMYIVIRQLQQPTGTRQPHWNPTWVAESWAEKAAQRARRLYKE